MRQDQVDAAASAGFSFSGPALYFLRARTSAVTSTRARDRFRFIGRTVASAGWRRYSDACQGPTPSRRRVKAFVRGIWGDVTPKPAEGRSDREHSASRSTRARAPAGLLPQDPPNTDPRTFGIAIPERQKPNRNGWAKCHMQDMSKKLTVGLVSALQRKCN